MKSFGLLNPIVVPHITCRDTEAIFIFRQSKSIIPFLAFENLIALLYHPSQHSGHPRVAGILTMCEEACVATKGPPYSGGR